MEPRRIEFTYEGIFSCPLNDDGYRCKHPDASKDRNRGCPDDREYWNKEKAEPPTWCPLRQRPALVVLKTGGGA